MISSENINDLLKDFPNDVEPCYENVFHNKVQNSDIFLIIPQGKKCFIWFTTYKEQNVCLLLHISNENKKINNYQFLTIAFHYTLSFNSIFYGTLFYIKNIPHIAIEDVFYYKGKNISFTPFYKKIKTFEVFFETDLIQYYFNKNSAIIGLCVLSNNLDTLMELVKDISYKIKFINYRFYNSPKKSLHTIKEVQNLKLSKCFPNNPIYKDKPNSFIFKVKPNIVFDIYDLYTVENNIETFYSVACIPNFKTSCTMNALFRNIKENNNLDLLEESDDEEDFENNNLNKFVFLDRTHNMMCMFDFKFKMFVPIRLAFVQEKVTSSKNLEHFIKILKK
jgi:hypothetical protein